MNIVLDTNILHQEGLGSRNMLLLSRLSKSDKINVYIPEIVKREYLSKKIISAKEDLSMVSGRLNNIKKWISSNKGFAEEIIDIEKKFKVLHQNVEDPINESFEQWMIDYNISIVDFESHNMGKVLDDYFSGGGVFKKVKNRDDLPDAMIYTTIQDILEFSGSVVVVIKDGNFKEHLLTIEGIDTFLGLSDLFEAPEIKMLIDELDSESKRIEEIKKILADSEVQHRFHEYILSDKSYLDSIYLDESEIQPNEEFGLDFWNAIIEEIDIDSIENISFGDVNFTDDNSFFINVSFFANAVLNFVADYSDFHILPDARKSKINLDSMNGDGVCDLSESLKFKFSGYIEIWLYDAMSPEQFKVHTQYIHTDESELSIELSIKSAEMKSR